jgi:hypothetical protein
VSRFVSVVLHQVWRVNDGGASKTARMGMHACGFYAQQEEHSKGQVASGPAAARGEARRWAALTAWQAGRYLAAAERVPGEVPPSTSMDDLRVYFEEHNHAIAEADCLTASTARLPALLQWAGAKRQGKNGEQVAVIRGLADYWDPPKQGR